MTTNYRIIYRGTPIQATQEDILYAADAVSDQAAIIESHPHAPEANRRAIRSLAASLYAISEGETGWLHIEDRDEIGIVAGSLRIKALTEWSCVKVDIMNLFADRIMEVANA